MRQHPRRGYDALSPRRFPARMLDVVASHHEFLEAPAIRRPERKADQRHRQADHVVDIYAALVGSAPTGCSSPTPCFA